MQALVKSLLKEEAVQVLDEAKNWQDALCILAKPLIFSGAINKSYVNSIIQNTKRYGPYFILSENFALPHALDFANVHRNSFSLLLLKKPLYFDQDERAIKLLIMIAPADKNFHMEKALPEIAEAFSKEDKVQKLLLSSSAEEVLKNLENWEDL